LEDFLVGTCRYLPCRVGDGDVTGKQYLQIIIPPGGMIFLG